MRADKQTRWMGREQAGIGFETREHSHRVRLYAPSFRAFCNALLTRSPAMLRNALKPALAAPVNTKIPLTHGR